jgi:protein-S-isoprenylcysteine O-methyltransferase Ste14
MVYNYRMVLKILPPIWFALLLAGGLLLHFFVPASHGFHASLPYVSVIAGAVILCIGIFLSQWASKIFAEENTEILPTSMSNRALVTRGPFRFSRNPMYLGILMTLVGTAILLGTLPMFVSAILFFALMNFIYIPFEEEKMRRQFTDAFDAYKKRVRRWL